MGAGIRFNWKYGLVLCRVYSFSNLRIAIPWASIWTDFFGGRGSGHFIRGECFPIFVVPFREQATAGSDQAAAK